MRKSKNRRDNAAHLRRFAASILSDGDDESVSAAAENSSAEQTRLQPLSMSGFSQFVLESESDGEQVKPVHGTVPSTLSESNGSGALTTSSAVGVSISSSFHFSDSDDSKDDSFEIRPPRKCSLKSKGKTTKAKKSTSDLRKHAANELSVTEGRIEFKCERLLRTRGEDTPLPTSADDALTMPEKEVKLEKLPITTAVYNENIRRGDGCMRTQKSELLDSLHFRKTIVLEKSNENELMSEELTNTGSRDVAVQVSLCPCISNFAIQGSRLCEASVQACLCECPAEVDSKPLSTNMLTEEYNAAIKHSEAHNNIDDCLSSALSRVKISDAASAASDSPALPRVQCRAVVDVQTVVQCESSAELRCSSLQNTPVTARSVPRDQIQVVAVLTSQDADVSADGSLVSVCDVSMQTSQTAESSLSERSPVSSDGPVEVVSVVGTPERLFGPSTGLDDVATVAGTPESLITVCDVSLQTSAVDSSLQSDLRDTATSEEYNRVNGDDRGVLEKVKSSLQYSAAAPTDVAVAPVPVTDFSLPFNEDFDPGTGFLSSTLACERRSVAAFEQLSSACFFGIGLSPVKDVEGANEDAVSDSETKRRRSKAPRGKKRVSMCAEFDIESPSEEFYTPNSAERPKDVSRAELTTVLDSDESCGDTMFKTVHDVRVPDSPVNEYPIVNKEVVNGQASNRPDDLPSEQFDPTRSPPEQTSAGETGSLSRDGIAPQR